MCVRPYIRKTNNKTPIVLFYCTSSLDPYYSRLTGSVESVEGHSAYQASKEGYNKGAAEGAIEPALTEE